MTADLVPSVSVANLVNQRAAVMERLHQAVALIREASSIALAAHIGMPRFEVATSYSRSSGTVIADAEVLPKRDGRGFNMPSRTVDEVADRIRIGVDCGAWQYLMHQSGLRSLMDADARAKWDTAITEGDVPELTEANVRTTFEMLHDSRGEMFERGVIAAFKALSWDYKTNLPQKFGKRIVLTFIRGQMSGKFGGTGLGHPNYDRCSRIDDLSRVLHVLDNKPEPDHRQGWYQRLNGQKVGDDIAEDGYLSIRSFRNGNGHITFQRLDLVDRMNKIIAKHYPGALPAPK